MREEGRVGKGLFRKQAMESISSPEELHDYMRVTSPRLWMLLAAVTVLLVSFIVYASTINMENTLPFKIDVTTVPVYSQNEKEETAGESQLSLFSAMLPLSYQDAVSPGMKVRMGDHTGKVSFVTISEENNETTLNLLLEMDDPALILPQGLYDGELVLETITPISFLWN